MNEYGYYGWSKVHDNSVRLPMCFSTYLHNLDLLLYFIISYLFIYTLAIVGCPCRRSLPTGSTHHVQKTPHAGLAQSLFERLIPFVLGVNQVKKKFYFIILYLYS